MRRLTSGGRPFWPSAHHLDRQERPNKWRASPARSTAGRPLRVCTRYCVAPPKHHHRRRCPAKQSTHRRAACFPRRVLLGRLCAVPPRQPPQRRSLRRALRCRRSRLRAMSMHGRKTPREVAREGVRRAASAAGQRRDITNGKIAKRAPPRSQGAALGPDLPHRGNIGATYTN